jgi:hypothetical protein
MVVVGYIIVAAQDAKRKSWVYSLFCTLIEVSMTSGILVLSACVVVIALLAIYTPAIYIREAKKILKLLEQIEANTRK